MSTGRIPRAPDEEPKGDMNPSEAQQAIRRLTGRGKSSCINRLADVLGKFGERPEATDIIHRQET